MLIRAACFILLWPAWALAETGYSRAELDRVRDRSVPNIIKVFEEDILGNLPRDLRREAAMIRFEFPDAGPSPLGFYAEPSRQTIIMPLSSIRFFDDVATLFAWIESKRCEQGFVHAYLRARLREGQPLQTPLRAFGIDRDTALADPYTSDLSDKIFSSGLQFIMAHEVGHILLNHRPGRSGAESQSQELEADAFAMEHFARLGGSPLGAFWYYVAAWWQDPVGDAVKARHSHPVSPARIRAMSARLLAGPLDFAHGENDPQREATLIRQLALMIDGFADIIDDDGMLTLMPMERDFPLTRLSRVCASG